MFQTIEQCYTCLNKIRIVRIKEQILTSVQLSSKEHDPSGL